jgi:branched-chain amino acid transport system ATP-binding protein
MSTCDRIIVLDFGSVIATGPPAEVRENEAVKEAYLGSTTEEVGELAELTTDDSTQPVRP